MSTAKFIAALFLTIHILRIAAVSNPEYLQPSILDRREKLNSTANLTDLLTWWHDTGEINTQTPVLDGNVRQSHLYSVQIAEASSPTTYYIPSCTRPCKNIRLLTFYVILLLNIFQFLGIPRTSYSCLYAFSPNCLKSKILTSRPS